MSVPFIGSRISLISKSDVRYEGKLCGIDTNESKVYLQHGKSLHFIPQIIFISLFLYIYSNIYKIAKVT